MRAIDVALQWVSVLPPVTLDGVRSFDQSIALAAMGLEIFGENFELLRFLPERMSPAALRPLAKRVALVHPVGAVALMRVRGTRTSF